MSWVAVKIVVAEKTFGDDDNMQLSWKLLCWKIIKNWYDKIHLSDLQFVFLPSTQSSIEGENSLKTNFWNSFFYKDTTSGDILTSLGYKLSKNVIFSFVFAFP